MLLLDILKCSDLELSSGHNERKQMTESTKTLRRQLRNRRESIIEKRPEAESAAMHTQSDCESNRRRGLQLIDLQLNTS